MDKILWRIMFCYAIAVIFTSGSIAQMATMSKNVDEEVPPEVQKIIDETMEGQHGLAGFEGGKAGMGFDKSTQLSYLKAGRPFKVYKILKDTLEKLGEDAPVSRIAKPIDMWEVPILLNGKCVTTFGVWKTSKNPNWHPGIFHGCYKEWQKVREAWPESEGYHPVIILASAWKRYFHIPEKDGSNLTPLFRHSNDSLESAADTSYRILVSSRTAFKYVRAHIFSESKGGSK
jgi:hypothetical protein